MPICTHCGDYDDYEYKSCDECTSYICSTECGIAHRGRTACRILRILPAREGALSERFMAKPAVKNRLAMWNEMVGRACPVITCMICNTQNLTLARSDGFALCEPCHADFVQGKRGKKKRLPRFDISEWVSEDDMKIVEADREERRRVQEYLQLSEDYTKFINKSKDESLIDEMCSSKSLRHRDQARIQLVHVWNLTRNWDSVVHAFVILSRGSCLPEW
jgi:hypothetical protein